MGKEDKPSVKIGTWPTPERTIQVSIPPQVAYDLKDFQKVQASILDRLGCPACCSGWDIRYDIIRSFAVDDKLKVREVPQGVVVVDG
jgi:hypothetical protein